MTPTDDDVYVNSGETFEDTTYYPSDPTERTESEAQDAAVLNASYPIMADVVDWFDEQIEACDSRRAIHAYALSHQLDPEVTAKAFDVVRELFEAKLKEFEHFRREQ